LLFNVTTAALEFDNVSSLKMDALEDKTPPEAVIEPKVGNIVSWKKSILKSIKAP
jgi:hypothetical protein